MELSMIKTGGTTSNSFKDWCDDLDEHKEFLDEGDKIVNVQHCQSDSGLNYFMVYYLTTKR